MLHPCHHALSTPQKPALIMARSGEPAGQAAAGAQPTARIGDESAGRDMLYSSGTTGRPKGVETELLDEAIDASNTLTNIATKLHGLDADSVYLSPVPLYQAAPLRRAGLRSAMSATWTTRVTCI